MILNRNILSEKLLDFAFTKQGPSELKVIGVGGGGCNAVNYMQNMAMDDVLLIVANTDEQALENSPVQTRIQLGETLTGGRGAGGKPEIGREAAIESIDQVISLVEGNTDMVFITAGMGGGTGTGATPILASKIKKAGILTVGVVTLPFLSEEGKRLEYAKQGIADLEKELDALIIIENEKLIDNYNELPLSEAFVEADKVLANAVKSIVEIIKVHGHWNVDFNDVRSVMQDSKVALMGTGISASEDRARMAVEQALQSPLLKNNNINGATNILVNIMSGRNEILVKEHQFICKYIQDISGHASKNFIVGTGRDESYDDEIKVTIIATGFEHSAIIDSWGKKNNEVRHQEKESDHSDQDPEAAKIPVTKENYESEEQEEETAEAESRSIKDLFKKGHKKKSPKNEKFHQWAIKFFEDDEIE